MDLVLIIQISALLVSVDHGMRVCTMLGMCNWCMQIEIAFSCLPHPSLHELQLLLRSAGSVTLQEMASEACTKQGHYIRSSLDLIPLLRNGSFIYIDGGYLICLMVVTYHQSSHGNDQTG